MMTFIQEPFGPYYPKTAAAPVEKFRRAARVSELEKWEKQRYGEAVEIWIRGLQRSALMSCLTPTPPLTRPSIPKPPAIERLCKYSKPNPFCMVGDPEDRDEESLYKHAMAQKRK